MKATRLKGIRQQGAENSVLWGRRNRMEKMNIERLHDLYF
jgi:hypothetical protein